MMLHDGQFSPHHVKAEIPHIEPTGGTQPEPEPEPEPEPGQEPQGEFA
jgi:hypothetical protein